MDIIVQARFSSQRLPGKILRSLGDRPLLDHLFDRLSLSKRAHRIFLATSTEASDDPVEVYAKQKGIFLFRGPLDNVAERFAALIANQSVKAFARISGDSPLLDPQMLDEMIGIFLESRFQMVTNVHPRSFPKGQSVEILNSDVFLSSLKNFEGPEDFEHVTPYFYRHDKELLIHNLAMKADHNDIRLCIDTPEDALVIENILRLMTKPQQQYSLVELISLYNQTQQEKVS